jgi:hypothetical protein
VEKSKYAKQPGLRFDRAPKEHFFYRGEWRAADTCWAKSAANMKTSFATYFRWKNGNSTKTVEWQ